MLEWMLALLQTSFVKKGSKSEDIGNHSICPRMCLNTCLISFLGKLLSAFYKSHSALSFKVILQDAIQLVCDELDATSVYV